MSWDDGEKAAKPSGKLGDVFDAAVRSLDGLPDVVKTTATTKTIVHPILSIAQTFVVQTYRQEEVGDTILVQYVGADGTYRIALPPAVANIIARQRDALATKSRRKGAQKALQTKIERGIEPAAPFRKRGAK